ncbi:MAG: pseudouridine synthase [Rikenellaceae bacterium]|nr:pseudouridine synthase [Rikenellaceae bacterium]
MLHHFTHDISAIALPEQFTWPFHYTPHPLCRLAAAEVEEYLRSRPDWAEEVAQGKMFGVLVVQTSAGEVGFLAAFSGNLAGTNVHSYFVPPVYDMLRPDDFFRVEEAAISAINRRTDAMLNAEEYTSSKARVELLKEQLQRELSAFKATLASRRANRQRRRTEGEDAATLTLESQRDNADLQRLKRRLREELTKAESEFAALEEQINQLRRERHERSAALQMRLFEQFRLRNARGEVKDLCELFAPTPQRIPPAGAGECAAPKLLQYAYDNSLKPIAMAEFWQGRSPRGEVRHHGVFYPSCNSKCKPILMFMMQGLNVEPNPLTAIRPPEPRILWEDEDVVAIDKPCGMLSVRGRSGVRSVEEWAEENYPTAEGPMIVHRLDQSTSGVLLIAKNKSTHQALQQQFISHTIEKSYVALIEGTIPNTSGRIDLRMCLDYENRPRQMVSPDGKRSITEYEVIRVEGSRTRIRLRPITGRTHQLRLHAAHHLGLGTPIVGDDIYGHECRADLSDGHRLCLHAEHIAFTHPRTAERIVIDCREEF